MAVDISSGYALAGQFTVVVRAAPVGFGWSVFTPSDEAEPITGTESTPDAAWMAAGRAAHAWVEEQRRAVDELSKGIEDALRG